MSIKLAMAIALSALGGCASMHSVVAEVHSFSNWPADQKPAGFAFERLPSQQANAEHQGAIEAGAAAALQAAGFTPADAATAQVLVEVHGGIRQSGALVDDHWGVGFNVGMGWGGPWPYGFMGPGFMQTPVYEYQVDLLMRNPTTHQVLFESHARHERVGGSLPLAKPLFTAALKFFPQGSNGAQNVSVSLEPNLP